MSGHVAQVVVAIVIEWIRVDMDTVSVACSKRILVDCWNRFGTPDQPAQRKQTNCDLRFALSQVMINRHSLFFHHLLHFIYTQALKKEVSVEIEMGQHFVMIHRSCSLASTHSSLPLWPLNGQTHSLGNPDGLGNGQEKAINYTTKVPPVVEIIVFGQSETEVIRH